MNAVFRNHSLPLPVILLSVSPDVVSIFQHEYRALRPRAPMPPIHVRFRRFTSLNTTIRLREGEIFASLSDLLEGAPESVLHAIAHILLAKLYRKPIDAAHNLRYKRFSSSRRRHATNGADPPRARQQALLRPRGPLLQSR